MLGTHADITARRATADSLRQSHELLMRVIDSVPARVFWKGKDLRYLGCNAAFAKTPAWTVAAVIGKRDHELGWAAQAEQYGEDDRDVMRTGQPGCSTWSRRPRPDGRTLWLRTTKVPLRNPEGEVIGLLGVYEDYTERRAVEEQLRKLSLAVEQSSEGIVITDLRAASSTSTKPSCNPAATPANWPSAQQFTACCSRAHTREPYDQMWQTLAQGQRWRGQFINRHRDGHETIEQATITPLRQARRQHQPLRGVLEDISDKQRIAEELQNHRHHLEELVAQRTADLQAAKKRADDISHYARSLLEASLDPLLTISAQGLITDANLRHRTRHRAAAGPIWWAATSDRCSPSPNAPREGVRLAFLHGAVNDWPLAMRHADGSVTRC
jgi:PAS domain S-box-containing protein